MNTTALAPSIARAQANAACLTRLYAVRPVWSRVVTAQAALDLPAMTLLHAGPPFRDPSRPSEPVLSSAVLCCLYEGWAADETQAETLIREGHVRLLPAQNFNVVTPLAAVISPSTSLVEITDTQSARWCWSLLGSGSGPQIRFGTRDTAVLDRLKWRDQHLAKALAPIVVKQPIDLFALAVAGLDAGDDLHASTTGATTALLALLVPQLAEAPEVSEMLARTPLFFLTLWMAACHLMLDAASDNGKDSTASLVIALAGNGQDVGIRLAGAPKRWRSVAACTPQGPRVVAGVACPMLGDSGVIDAAGFGAQAWRHARQVAADMAAWRPGTPPGPAAWQLGAHNIFGAFGLASAIDGAAVSSASAAPNVAIAMLDVNGRKGLLGRGVCLTPSALFAAEPADGLTIDAGDAHTELQLAFERYEAALVGNNLEVLDELFWDSAYTVRYGATEQLYGIHAIREFRNARPAAGLERVIVERSVTTFGNDFGVTNMVFKRAGQHRVGRQTQSWVRLDGEWKIVAAHVSINGSDV